MYEHSKANARREPTKLAMTTLVAATGLPPALCILPNIKRFVKNFPHDRDATGICIQTTAVRTILRVGLRGGTLPAGPMHVTMSFHTASQHASGEITAEAVKSLGLSTYGQLASTSLELRNHEVLPAAESDGGVARGACVAEVTFIWRFGVTAALIPWLDGTDTPVWLRFTVDGSPHLSVDTPHFRLVARNCGNRNPKVKKLVLATQKLITQVPSRDRGAIVLALGPTHPSQNHSSNLHPETTLTLTLP
eukprot:scaffold4919_cov43-Phaeocystis_antarctica.AAC.2